ncbi:MAG: hypothetical protein MUO68_15975 [Desulfobacteraceae bacterium]|nr:hypothetical protein [Desulfobacteraceae bacterium]
MNKTPWKSDNWFVSPWNYLPEVTKGFQPPKQVKIHDVTLRDGEQQAGITLTKDDKIRIAEKLAEVGVHRIEAGMPATSVSDEAAIREIVKRNSTITQTNVMAALGLAESIMFGLRVGILNPL